MAHTDHGTTAGTAQLAGQRCRYVPMGILFFKGCPAHGRELKVTEAFAALVYYQSWTPSGIIA